MSGAGIVVVGRSGQLARELAALARRERRPLVCAGRETFDLAHGDPRPWLAQVAPAAVINAAAYTAVDRAESEPKAAFALNHDGPTRLAGACAELGVPLVHVSTDYVFDGRKGAPYVEGDAAAPLNVYGHSKRAGEQAVLAAGGQAAVLRTSWVFGRFGSGFLHTMLRLAASADEITVVGDQIGRPTYAPDLARAAVLAAEGLAAGAPGTAGLFHVSGREDASWAGFAQAILDSARTLGLPHARVRPVTSAERGAPATRPADSRLDSSLFSGRFGWAPTPTPEALALTLAAFATGSSEHGAPH